LTPGDCGVGPGLTLVLKSAAVPRFFHLEGIT
jgi:hypothetical protein